jgi:hypothetical protein
MPDRYREREIARLRDAMERRLHSPRLQMALIVALAGAAGFFTSVTLFHLRLDALWLRYPIAAAAGYATFLFLLWCWLRLQSEDVLDDPDPVDLRSDLRLPRRDAVHEDVWIPRHRAPPPWVKSSGTTSSTGRKTGPDSRLGSESRVR